VLLVARLAAAQEGPVNRQDPEPIGAGLIRVGVATTYGRDVFYPLSGLEGNLLQLAVAEFEVGLSPIADFELSGGPYNRLSITDRRSAPLASLVTATGASTHAVEDIVIGTKIRLVPEDAGRPAVAFRFAVRLPNAKHPSGLGQDTTDFSAALLTGKTWGPLRAVGTGGVMIMSEPLNASKQNDVLTYGGSVRVAMSHHTDALGEISGWWSVRHGIPPVGTESRGIATIGGRYTHGPVQLDAGAMFGVTSIGPGAGVTVGVRYTFRAFSLP